MPVCVGPNRKPHCWFSQEAAHFMLLIIPTRFFVVVRIVCESIFVLFDPYARFHILVKFG